MALTLTNTTDMPPGGYAYREPAIAFNAPPHSELALMGLVHVAKALQQARVNNPGAGLNPAIEACVEAVKAYQCARFARQPRVLAEFCSEAPVVLAAATDGSMPLERKGACRSCGRRR